MVKASLGSSRCKVDNSPPWKPGSLEKIHIDMERKRNSTDSSLAKNQFLSHQHHSECHRKDSICGLAAGGVHTGPLALHCLKPGSWKVSVSYSLSLCYCFRQEVKSSPTLLSFLYVKSIAIFFFCVHLPFHIFILRMHSPLAVLLFATAARVTLAEVTSLSAARDHVFS